MKKLTMTLAAFALISSGPALALGKDHGDKSKHKMMKHDKMECTTDKDGKKTCKKMDHSKMKHGKKDHGKMDHSKMDHGKTKSQ